MDYKNSCILAAAAAITDYAVVTKQKPVRGQPLMKLNGLVLTSSHLITKTNIKLFLYSLFIIIHV